MDVFNIKSIAGQYTDISSYANEERIKVVNILLDEVFNYFNYLTSLGYRKISENKFAKNISAHFTNNVFSVFLFYTPFNHTLFVTKTIKCPIKTINSSSILVDNLSIMQLPVQGMGYVVQLLDGSFILIDGGEYSQTDCESLFNYLVKNTPNGNEIKIDTWFFSHPHFDHIGLATEFIKKYHSKVKINSFAYNFPSMDKISLYMESKTKTASDILNLENAIDKYYKHSIIYPTYTGQEYAFQGLKVQVLFSIDNHYPIKEFYSNNDFSFVLKFNFDCGKTALFLSDCMSNSCDMLNKTYGDYLKSDILQVAHHGLFGGDLDLYKNIDPDICLWPIRQDRFFGIEKDDLYKWCLGDGGLDFNAYLRDNKIKEREHIHNGNVRKINL